MHCPKTRRVAFALILAAFAISRAAVGGESDPKASSDSGEFFPLAKMNAGVGVDDLRQRWYSKHLAAMHEPSLWDLSKRPKKSGEAYRFLWLRTFDEPVAIRVEKATDGAARLYTRVLDGKGGYAPGMPKVESSKSVTADEWAEFSRQLDDCAYWVLRTDEDHSLPGGGGLKAQWSIKDGAEWVLEGVRSGKYHLVQRQCPVDDAYRKAGKYRAACLFLLKLSSLQIEEKKVY